MTIGLGVVIEGLVAALLLITIVYCAVLNKRLARLKADEQALKATISELITATEIAERAIGGLKQTVQECDQNLGERLGAGSAMLDAIGQQIAAGEQVVGKLAQIAGLSRVVEAAASSTSTAKPVAKSAPAQPDLKATVAAAQAFAARTRLRGQGVAA